MNEEHVLGRIFELSKTKVRISGFRAEILILDFSTMMNKCSNEEVRSCKRFNILKSASQSAFGCSGRTSFYSPTMELTVRYRNSSDFALEDIKYFEN